MAVFFFTAQVAWAGNIKTEKVTLVGNGIVEFIPVGYDVSCTPSLILSHEPEKKGEVPENWKLVPQFTMTDGKANASLDVPAGTSLYGGGEVTGPLLRNGQKIKMWNTDNASSTSLLCQAVFKLGLLHHLFHALCMDGGDRQEEKR